MIKGGQRAFSLTRTGESSEVPAARHEQTAGIVVTYGAMLAAVADHGNLILREGKQVGWSEVSDRFRQARLPGLNNLQTQMYEILAGPDLRTLTRPQ